MSIILNGTSESLRVVLAAAPSSTQLAATASWADQAAASGDSAMLTTGVTAITLVAAPAANVSRWVGGVTVFNQDTAAATVTVQKVTAGGSFTLFKARILPGCHLFYDNAAGWRVVDANGCVLTSSNQSPAVPISGARNLIINGDMRVNQSVFAGGALAANTYGYDQWRTGSASASLTLAAARDTITLNGTVYQVIEAPDAAGATVTVSVSNPSGPITVALQPDGTTTGVSGVIPAGAGQQSVTLVIPSSITGNVFLLLTTSAATTFDGPAKRSGIQVEYGSFATAFERMKLGDELIRCRRYYKKSYRYATPPGSGGSANYPGIIDYFATAATTAQFNVCVTHGEPMRVVPTITFYDLAGAAGFGYRGANGAAIGVVFPSESSFNANFPAGANTTEFAFHYVADARF